MRLKIAKEDIIIDLELKRKVDVICSFCNINPIYKNGSIRRINKTNIVYIEPHKIIIKSLILLVFNEHDYFTGSTNKARFPAKYEMENSLKKSCEMDKASEQFHQLFKQEKNKSNDHDLLF